MFILKIPYNILITGGKKIEQNQIFKLFWIPSLWKNSAKIFLPSKLFNVYDIDLVCITIFDIYMWVLNFKSGLKPANSRQTPANCTLLI